MESLANPSAACASGVNPAGDNRQMHQAHARYEAAFEGRDAPFAFVDMDAMWSNSDEMLARAGGKPIRVASKSVRCRALLEAIARRDERYRGLMTFTLRESLWLGEPDMLLAYPTADREALGRMGEDGPVLMVDSVDHLDLIESATNVPVRLCIEVDLSYPLAGGRVKVGVKRSPVRSPEQAVALAREIERRPRLKLAGLMGYEAHIAGLGDNPPGKPVIAAVLKRLQKASAAELAERRAAVVEALGPLDFVNGGGTGSVHTTAREPVVTEITAGSGFYAPTLFDHYSAFTLTPAAMFALPVVRKPSKKVATVLGGGYIASGPADKTRLPSPYLPEGLKLDGNEGAGEVQTPVIGADMRVGDRVYFRHAKAGELCERFNTLLLVRGSEIVDEVPTYRGEGCSFL
jgi:D-serine deaminase-like pyridoxal phosphate-dependent protein